MNKILFCLLLLSSPLLADVSLSELMSPQDMKQTGVAKLTPQERGALERWIDQRFEIKTTAVPKPSTEAYQRLSLSLNVNGGRKLLLSDQSLWEVSPDDVDTASAWLSPVTIEIRPSDNPIYTSRLVNMDAEQTVKARRVNPVPTQESHQ
ncbi:MAG: hypothetical protein HYX48_01215 [Chlamydiales bacterium]|nr:hypothetical protein [Chlamydiales bacterium]